MNAGHLIYPILGEVQKFAILGEKRITLLDLEWSLS
jgi:hypothetical protein